MRYSWSILLILTICLSSQAQVKSERAFRIRKEQFPTTSLEITEPYLQGVKKLRFYKEIDSSRYRYMLTFKKDRLRYRIDFDGQGDLEAVAFRIEPVDIPEESWKVMERDLQDRFVMHKVRQMEQRYPREAFPSAPETFRTAFQNLILPEVQYAMIVRGKKEEGQRSDYEIRYDHSGRLLSMSESLPPNRDHVLY